ncbi:MAG TPA: hypothetical protein VKX96_11650, partial [Chloroflexota bacterium]|nr:hypothetical protein [Chloroflexota bacterium]
MNPDETQLVSAQALPAGWEILARETFRDFPVGPFPYDYTALAEYHDVQFAEYRGRWREATTYHAWRDAATWNAIDDNGQMAIEQSCVRDKHLPILETGRREWSDYRVSARIRPIFAKPAPGKPVVAPIAQTAQGIVGLIARYVDSRNYVMVVFTSDDTIELRRSTHDGFTTLASAPLAVDQDHQYLVTLEAIGERLTAIVDGQTVLTVTDPTFPAGKIALVANVPARFQDVVVSAPTEARQSLQRRLSEDQRVLLAERERYPQPVLDRVIRTPGFGASKHVRFADLDNDGR